MGLLEMAAFTSGLRTGELLKYSASSYKYLHLYSPDWAERGSMINIFWGP